MARRGLNPDVHGHIAIAAALARSRRKRTLLLAPLIWRASSSAHIIPFLIIMRPHECHDATA